MQLRTTFLYFGCIAALLMNVILAQEVAESNVCSNCYIYGYTAQSAACDNSMVCSGDTPYCLTTYSSYTYAPTLAKTCAGYDKCKREWWDLTRNNPNCMDVDPTTWADGTVGECDYCCTTADDGTDDWCNRDSSSIAPDNLMIMADPTTEPPTAASVTALETEPAATTEEITTEAHDEPESNVCSNCYSYGYTSGSYACDNSMVCSGDTPYCLTTYTTYGYSPVLATTCASYDKCKREWWDLTRNNPNCMDVDPTTWADGTVGECDYCCTTPDDGTDDWCNKDRSSIVPDNLLIMGSTTEPTTPTTTAAYIVPEVNVCSTCVDVNGETPGCERYTHCYGNTPYCMTSYTAQNGETTLLKTCASYDQCESLWWDFTRFEDKCMNEDPVNWEDGAIGQCYYCCYTPEEDGTADWCNKDSSVTLPDNLLDMYRLVV